MRVSVCARRCVYVCVFGGESKREREIERA